MKIYLHYTIWNKVDHIDWIINGILDCIPKGSVLDFVFDNSDNCHEQLKINFYRLTDFTIYHESTLKQYRWRNTNDAIERFIKSDCDLFLSPQDDMNIQDKHLIPNLIKLYSENTEIGLVGMRDGIDYNGKFFSSNFSRGDQKTYWLKDGEYQQVEYVNDGPICLSKYAIEKIGLFNTEFIAHFADNDFCFRANALGLKNFVMGANIVHEKMGRIIQSEVWDKEVSDHDWAIYKRLWPGR